MAARPSDLVLPVDARLATWRLRVPTLWVGIAAVAGLVVLARLTGLNQHARIQEFVLVFASIAIEALPFVLVGALVSGLMGVYVPDRAFARVRALPAAVQVPGALACALAFPVCECSSVPVARRLAALGVHPSAAIAFMLAAPIVNPVVLGSTWMAYGGGSTAVKMTIARAACGILVALAAAVALGRLLGRSRLLPSRCCADGHEHPHQGGRLTALADHVAGDFVFMGKFLVLGAAAAALLQTAVPQDAVSSFASAPVLGPLGLMAMAFLLSLCSEADAFVAISFGGFSLGSQLAFLAFGPVLDIKLAVLYGAVFRKTFAPALALLALPLLLAAALVFDAVVA